MSKTQITFTVDSESIKLFKNMCNNLKVNYSTMVNTLIEYSIKKNNEINIIEFINQEMV